MNKTVIDINETSWEREERKSKTKLFFYCGLDIGIF